MIVIVFIVVVVGVAVVDDGVGGVGGVDLKKSGMIVMRFDCYCFYICCWCCFVVDVVAAVVVDAGVVQPSSNQKLKTFC